jgi:hypothetical protein
MLSIDSSAFGGMQEIARLRRQEIEAVLGPLPDEFESRGDGIRAIWRGPTARIVIRQRSEPSLADKAGSLAAAIGGSIGNLVSGSPVLADADEQARRIAICNACPHLDQIKRKCVDFGGLKGCGCPVDRKATIAASKCPQCKWA